jgi:hypothetical protein
MTTPPAKEREAQEKSMEQGCTTRFPSYIDKLLIQDLPPGKMSRLRDHLTGCPSCKQRYNRVVLASRLLNGGPDALDLPAQRELDWLEPEILQRARLMPDSAPARRSILPWLAPVLTTAAIVAIVLPLALRTSPPGSTPRGDEPPAIPVEEPLPAAVEKRADDELQARGQGSSKEGSRVGLRAFCIKTTPKKKDRGEASGAKIVGLVPAAQGDPLSSCRVKDILRFAYTNRSNLGYLFLVGLDEKYRVKWYEPHPPVRSSIPLEQNSVDKPLTRAVRLRVNHTEGQLRIFAIFSEKPLLMAHVKKAVATAREAKRPLTALTTLPLEQTEQRSLLVKLEP